MSRRWFQTKPTLFNSNRFFFSLGGECIFIKPIKIQGPLFLKVETEMFILRFYGSISKKKFFTWYSYVCMYVKVFVNDGTLIKLENRKKKKMGKKKAQFERKKV